MAKLSRVFQKLFGTDGTASYFGKFGSKAAAAPVNTKDPATIQALQAFLDGWESAIISGSEPALEDMNSLFLLAFYQLAYLMQAGIAEYDSSTYYYTGSYCQVSGVIYKSLTDDNVGNAPASSPTNWQLLQFVGLTGNETVAGIKTFSSSPIVPLAVSSNQAANLGNIEAAIVPQVGFGSWASKLNNTVYLAATDGFVVACSTTPGYGAAGYTDSSTPPTTQRIGSYLAGDSAVPSGITMPVKKGDYWKVTNCSTVYWLPLGS